MNYYLINVYGNSNEMIFVPVGKLTVGEMTDGEMIVGEINRTPLKLYDKVFLCLDQTYLRNGNFDWQHNDAIDQDWSIAHNCF